MAETVVQKLIGSHLVEGEARPGREISIRIDQTLTQDATGTLVMEELEAMELERVRTELSVQYVDHNLLQEDSKNPDDHLYLESACRKFGLWFSRPGNGISHVVHMQRFGIPGRTLLGSDSHTCAAGSLGMLAIGAGGLDVALAMAGVPFRLRMPEVWGIELRGELREWASAKDVILELLRRHGVRGGLGRTLEYHGPGLVSLSAMDRHVIANMGAELGATTSVFPSDEETRRYLRDVGREDEWREISADAGRCYDDHEVVDLSRIEPLIAKPSSPGNVVLVRELAGEDIYQAYLGSSANPGLRDFAVPAAMVRGRQVHPQVSFDVNPTSRQDLERMIDEGVLGDLIRAGARLHQAGCNGCIGMGQAPATSRNSLRTTPRNFPGRSGATEDSVYLCSPETATASALTGRITDPRDLGMPYPEWRPKEPGIINRELVAAPPPPGTKVDLAKGPNIRPIPDLDPIPDSARLPVLLVLGDDVSTDDILPAGARVLPFRSNIPRISDFVFEGTDPGFVGRTRDPDAAEGHAILAGANYGQGSSREHAALAARYLGLRLVLARGFARIHRRNLINFGVLPLTLEDESDYEWIAEGDVLAFRGLHRALRGGDRVLLRNETRDRDLRARHSLTGEERETLLAGGILARVAAELNKTTRR